MKPALKTSLQFEAAAEDVADMVVVVAVVGAVECVLRVAAAAAARAYTHAALMSGDGNGYLCARAFN